MSSKLWTAASVRKLARARLQAEESPPPVATEPAAPPHLKIHDEHPSEKLKMKYNPNEFKLEWMWGRFEKSSGNRVVLAVPEDDPDGGEEMTLLCETLGLEVIETMFYSMRAKPSASTYVSSGAVAKMRQQLQSSGGAALILDAPLSPAQVRNLEEAMKGAVVDRQGVILAIFELHAKTKLAKMQVELARLKYLQPRLAGLWMGLSRQRGSSGGLGGRGQGETRLELDRRVVKKRIAVLAKKLKESEKAFTVQSARRHDLPRVALVGYTNAGKSSLMRALTRSPVDVEDKLFSTLETTVRPLAPPTSPKILLSDTVGFVRDLPHDLVASFKSTLQEALDSQLILQVVDIAHPRWRQHIETTDAVLEEIGATGIPKILVLNKMDLVSETARLRQSEVNRFMSSKEGYLRRTLVSALTGEGLGKLREELIQHFGAGEPVWSETWKANF